jgi:hypothetical protein
MSDIKFSPSDNLWTEPESAANTDYQPTYPYNSVTQTESGHTFEMDDTPTRERIRLNHRSGTFIEMHPDGDEVHKVYGDGYEITIKNKNIIVKGTCNLTVEGNYNIDVLGDMNTQVAGDYNVFVKGKTNVRSHRDISISGDDDVSISANENFGGALRLSAADHFHLAADLVVSGSISADFISSSTRVNAGTGVYAGPLGFVSSFGGLSLGVPSAAAPIAVPGSINTVGPISSLTAVNAPLANFALAQIGIMDAVLMTDVINSAVFNGHIHQATGPFAPTTPPLIQFLSL